MQKSFKGYVYDHRRRSECRDDRFELADRLRCPGRADRHRCRLPLGGEDDMKRARTEQAKGQLAELHINLPTLSFRENRDGVSGLDTTQRELVLKYFDPFRFNSVGEHNSLLTEHVKRNT